jgi:hypothetical protein
MDGKGGPQWEGNPSSVARCGSGKVVPLIFLPLANVKRVVTDIVGSDRIFNFENISSSLPYLSRLDVGYYCPS